MIGIEKLFAIVAVSFISIVGFFIAAAIFSEIFKEYSLYSYCKGHEVPYGMCEVFIKENYATQNIKLRVNNETTNAQ